MGRLIRAVPLQQGLSARGVTVGGAFHQFLDITSIGGH
jgi:hypothetical protein